MKRLLSVILAMVISILCTSCTEKENNVKDPEQDAAIPAQKREYGEKALEDAVLRFSPYNDGGEDSFCILMFDDGSLLYVCGDRRTDDITSDDIMSKVYSQKHILPSEDVRANIKEMIVDVKEQAQDHREVVADATLVQVYVDGKVYSGRFSKPYSGRISANALDMLNGAFHELFGYEINTPAFA